MDYLKTSAPFWKREESAKGASWVEARVHDDAAAARFGNADARGALADPYCLKPRPSY